MSSNVSEGVMQKGNLLVHIVENGHSFEPDCDEYTLVEAVQRYLESAAGIHFNDQLLLCLDMKLESQQPLSAYKLPSNDREVYLFNRAKMRSNAGPPAPEQVEIVEIPDPPIPTSSHNPHPLDEASDPALKALPSYERQFRYHCQRGDAIYNRTLQKYGVCEKFLREQKVQEKALEIARGNLDHFYRMILQNYMDFVKCYSQQQRTHSNLLLNFGRDIEKLRSCKLIPALQTANRKCLLDFVKEENVRKSVEDCSSSHRQFENKVGEFKQEFGELKRITEHLFSSKVSTNNRDLDRTIKEHQHFINEQKSIMQALSKGVGMVKNLVDDCLTSQLSSSLRPHDAVSALGPMYEGHEKSYLPKMQECERAISSLLVFCKDKKTEINNFVHGYMQKIAYIQYTIKEVRYKFSVFTEALKRQNDHFEHLKVVRGIGHSYRACLAEIVRRKASMKLYMGMAGQMAERLGAKRESEISRREEFLKVQSSYIPKDILASMGLYDTPSQCDVNITPFDTNLLDIDLSDLERYAPDHLLGLSFKSDKHGSSKGSFSMSNDGSQAAGTEDSSVDANEKYDSEDLLDSCELVEIAGTSKMEVENAKLKAELASAIALLCAYPPEIDYESLDDSKVESLLRASAEKTAEALHKKDEYGKHLQSMLKVKHRQCESYEKRIRELEQRLSDSYSLEHKLNKDDSNLHSSTGKADDSKSEITAYGEAPIPYLSIETMDEVSYASSSSNVKLEVLDKQGKTQEGLDENMTDSSGILNPQLDSSMLEQNRDEVNVCEKGVKDSMLGDTGMTLATSSTDDSTSRPLDTSPSDPGCRQDFGGNASLDIVQKLQSLVAEKENQLSEATVKIESLVDQVAKLGGELEISQKLLNESQMNCAHLENCLHEAGEEAQTHLCSADRRASHYTALRASAVKIRSLFERLKNCVSSSGVAAFAESLHALAQSLANSAGENEDDGTAEFRECVLVLADKVGIILRHRGEILDRYSKAEAANEQLTNELEEKKELVNTLYIKHQLEKQANKEKISFGRLEVQELAAFVLGKSGHYEAINKNCSHYYLSAESVALFVDHLPSRPSHIIGQIVHIERQTVRSLHRVSKGEQQQCIVDMLTTSDNNQLILTSGSTPPNPCGLPVGSEYFVVTVAMLPDTTIHLQSSS